jgi:hypothetical protein
MPEVEIFTPTGVLAGTVDHAPLTNEGSDLLESLVLRDGRWYPIDGSPTSLPGETEIDSDDILVIVTPPPDMLVHMIWHTLALDVGPYRVTGEFATHPGFDPTKSIARPSGPFVALRGVTIELTGAVHATTASREHVHVNRYAVDQVESRLMLGHFFPGARLVVPETEPVG